MKIGIVIRHCRKYHSSRYVIETSEHFLKLGHKLDIFTNDNDPLNKKIRVHYVPIISGNFYTKEISFTAAATIMLARQKNKFDVTLAQPTRYFSPSVAEIQFLYKSWAEYKNKNNIPLNWQDKFTPTMEGYNLNKAKMIITMAETLRDQIIDQYKINEEKIQTVYSGVDSQTFHPKNKKYSAEIRAKHNIAADDTMLLFVGAPFVRKGLNFMIKAIPKIKQKNKNIKLLVIEGKNDNPTPYKSLAARLGVGNNVIFAPRSSEIYKYFGAADVFVLPTLYEPFGLVILEAMACGLPVVVSQIAGAAELITPGKDGILLENPENPDEIADKVNSVISSNNAMKQIGKQARATAEKYTWQRTAEDMLEVFEKSLEMK
jgi:UDP-glucose:(heptosyl)LPS alpha-1,3-glucosyltransferase